MRNTMIGVIIGILLAYAGTAFADGVQNMIGKTVQGQFNVMVNGEKLEVPAIVVDGASFLPVRGFGEAVGYEVLFDPEGEIVMNKTPSTESTLEVLQTKLDEARTRGDIREAEWLTMLIENYDEYYEEGRYVGPSIIRKERTPDEASYSELNESEKKQLEMFGMIFKSPEAIEGQIRAEQSHLYMYKSRLHGVEDGELKKEFEKKVEEYEKRIEFLQSLKAEMK